MIRTAALRLAALVLVALAASPASAQSRPSFQLRVGEAADGWVAQVLARGMLEDRALRGALESALPLRFRLRVELWRRATFDQLAGEEEIFLALVQDPLDRAFRLETRAGERRMNSLAAAQRAVEEELRSALRPRQPGRYYYLASLDVETLSLSDLEELRRWLRGDFRPAVEGRASPGRAVERGIRRVFVRVIGLPTRRYEGRSSSFVVP